MVRSFLLFSIVILGSAMSSSGCRSCSSCHDYDAPVANGDCNACGTRRAGSVSGGYVGGEYLEEGAIINGEANRAPTEDSQESDVSQ